MKKGFTLVELLAVITLLSIVIALTFPALMGKLNQKQTEIDGALMTTVKAGANKYVNDNQSVFNDHEIHNVTFQTLVDADYLDKSILKDYADYCVKVSYSSNQYQYEILTSCE